MAARFRSSWAAFAILLLGAELQASASSAQDDVPARLKELWGGLGTFRVSSTESPLNAQIVPGRGKPAIRYEVAYGAGGRRMLRSRTPDLKGPIFQWRCEDGKRGYRIRSFDGCDDLLDAVFIENQKGVGDTYLGTMCQVLWVLMPGGKPLTAHLQDGAKIEEQKAGDGSTVPVLVGTHKGMQMRCELDPRHDYLPRVIDLKDFMKVEVTRFERKSGRWFPVAGTTRYTFPGAKQADEFVVDEFAINEELPETTFRPKPTPGCVIVDETTGKTTVEGGPAARDDLERKRRNASVAPPAPKAPLTAQTDPPRSPWPWVIGLGSAGALAVVGLVVLRSRS